jgi:hypothetical protein
MKLKRIINFIKKNQEKKLEIKTIRIKLKNIIPPRGASYNFQGKRGKEKKKNVHQHQTDH